MAAKRPNRFAVRRHLTLFIAAITLAGCGSAYNTTISDFSRPEANRLADRVQTARVSRAESRAQLDTARAGFTALLNAASDARSGKHRSATVAIERAELKRWNARKDVLAIEDVWKKLQRESPDAAASVRSDISAMLRAMHQSDEATTTILDELRGPGEALHQPPGPTVHQAVQHRLERMDAYESALDGHIADGEQRAQRVMDRLLGSEE